MAAAFQAARHNISQHVLCGESAGVDPKLISDGKELAAAVIKDYNPKDVFNMDETGLFDIILHGIECTDEMEEGDLQDFLRRHKKCRASFRRSAVHSDITRFFNVKDY